jgi:ABC-2 type transport system permease protein
MKSATSETPLRVTAADVIPADRERGLPWSALATLFGLTVRQHLHGRRLLVVSFLFLLPFGLSILARAFGAPAYGVEFAFVFTLIPHALLPLAALLYASGVVSDELEDQTLTYLLIRPIPKWAIYVTKLLATLCITVALVVTFTLVTYVPVFWGTPEFWGAVFPLKPLQAALLFALSLVAYCSLFGWIGLMFRRSLVLGVAYIVMFEWFLSNIDFAIRRLTVTYYWRVLADRWLDIRPNPNVRGASSAWSLGTDEPSTSTCLLVLLGVSAVLTLLAALNFSRREFHLKTPEGS